jgi:hypothetical protein
LGPLGTGRSSYLPRGALVRYREWYGKVGHKLTADDVGTGIVDLERGDVQKLSYAIMDPSAFSENGGPSIMERLNDVLNKERMVAFTRADNARVARQIGETAKGGPMSGWDMFRSRLIGTAKRSEQDGSVDWMTGRPMMYVFDTCRDFIRTVPVLQHDPHRAEDLDTHAEDHAADDARYACVSRPWVKSLPKDDAIKRDSYRSSSDDRYGGSTATL